MGDYMKFLRLRSITPSTLALLVFVAPASAHHPMGGKTPSTFIEGLLSGFGHPIIGPDHLAFLVAVGVIVGVGGLNLALPAIFVSAMAIGVALHVNGIALPAGEVIVALSVILVGLLIARGRALPVMLWAALFALAGLFHGHALGETVFGAEPAPLGAYLLGLVVVQSVLTIAIAALIRAVGIQVAEKAPRFAGVLIVAVGLAVLLGQLLPGA